MVNDVRLVGFIGADLQLRHTPDGTPVTDTSLAVNETYKDRQGNTKESTEWFRIEFWSKNAENAAKLLAKGAQIALRGSLKNESYTKEDGTKVNTVRVRVSEFVVTRYAKQATA